MTRVDVQNMAMSGEPMTLDLSLLRARGTSPLGNKQLRDPPEPDVWLVVWHI